MLKVVAIRRVEIDTHGPQRNMPINSLGERRPSMAALMEGVI